MRPSLQLSIAKIVNTEVEGLVEGTERIGEDTGSAGKDQVGEGRGHWGCEVSQCGRESVRDVSGFNESQVEGLSVGV